MTKKKFESRKESAEDTALWMKADVHRAMSAGESVMTVKIADLVEILAYIDSVKKREKLEFSGKPLGFCKAEEVRALLVHELPRIFIVPRRGEKFNTQVFFSELPPIPEPEPTN